MIFCELYEYKNTDAIIIILNIIKIKQEPVRLDFFDFVLGFNKKQLIFKPCDYKSLVIVK